MTDNRLRQTLSIVYSLIGVICILLALAFGRPVDDELGTKVFKKRCQMCHAGDGTGSTKAGKAMKTPDITTVEWKNGKTVADLEKTLREGLGKMPKYSKKLNDGELKAVASYVVEKFGSNNQ